MSFIGNSPTQQAFAPAIDYFSGTGSQTTFTLSRPLASSAQIIVAIENAIQNPAYAFTISGNTITFTSAPPANALLPNNIWVEYTSPITQVMQPGQGTVGLTQLIDGSVSTSKLGTGVTDLINNAYAGQFWKANPRTVAFTATGTGTAVTAFALKIDINFVGYSYASGTTVIMPSLTAGTSYAIYACTDGTIRADSNFTAPSGYSTTTSRYIGGFHYAPGGNATGTSGGNTTPAINPYSFYDLKFRPNNNDPRAMTLVAGTAWVDIYLTNTNPGINGTSAYNVPYARGTTPPVIPTLFGGNGSTTYSEGYTWFGAAEVASAYGKQLMTQRLAMAAFYGSTENSSVGSDQTNTILNAAYTSKWGVIQSTGVLWQWGDDRGGAYNTGGWNNNTNGRGQEYNASNAVILGGNWNSGVNAGSRCAAWDNAASFSNGVIGSRFACDHLVLV